MAKVVNIASSDQNSASYLKGRRFCLDRIGKPSLTFLVLVLAYLAGRCMNHPAIPSFRPDKVFELSSGLTIVVTGANSGLGFDTVDHLVRAGGAKTIVMACRSMAKCETAKERVLATNGNNRSNDDDNDGHVNATIDTKILTMQLDLADRDSIRQFARKLPEALTQAHVSNFNGTGTTNHSIDVLVNNAGIFTRSATGFSFQNGIDEHILINHLGHVLLLHYLWPKLLQDKTRIVSVSSIAALLPWDPSSRWYEDASCNKVKQSTIFHTIWNNFGPKLVTQMFKGMNSYSRSKRANILFTHELHKRYASSHGISSVASHPGVASTELWTTGAKIFPKLISHFLQTNRIITQSSREAAATQVWAALDRRRIPSGWYVGPRWWFKGSPILLGPITQRRDGEGNNQLPDDHYYLPLPHFWPFFSEKEGEKLWESSMDALNITEFGVHPSL